MKKKQFLNGAGLGSTSEPATKSSYAPNSAATGIVELDDDSLASVAGGAIDANDCGVDPATLAALAARLGISGPPRASVE